MQAMDKNPKYTQSSSKGVPAESKKNQDVANNKLLPKTSRRREPAGASNFSRHEQPRKSNNVQKAKNFDKRPKPKGQYHGGSKEDTKVVEADMAELGSIMVQGSKKQNLNHLLNFHYEPRDMQGGLSTSSYGKSSKGYNRNSNRWLPPTQRHKYNKEQFLQASCQFVVTANGNYTLYLTDPDMLVDWKLVEQVKIYSSNHLSCPICLCAPVAGKMTRCGHVYCWPCILHYLSLSDKSWRKCPICYESIHSADLKSVIEITQSTLNLGDTVTLRLMRREKGSLLAVPVGSLTQTPINFFSVSDNIGQQVYSKLLIASAKDIMDIIECERVQLTIELMDNPDTPENCYIEQALNELEKRKEELLQKNELACWTEVSAEHAPETTLPLNVSLTKEKLFAEEPENVDTSIDNSCKDDSKTCVKENAKTEDNTSVVSQSHPNSQKIFYFYQADDGQHVYLHAMNVKMLEMQYGSLENCPHVITGKLLEKEGGSVTEDLRRRLRYLCHLPITCQFEVAEIELKPPIISEEVMSSFHDQLVLRQRRRDRRDREERKREKKITEEENKRMGKYPTPIVHIDSQRHFPQWQPEPIFSEENVVSPPESGATSSVASSPSLSTFEEIVSSRQTDSTQEQGPSFAQMLRNKGTRIKLGGGWPSVSSAHTKPHPSMSEQSSSRDVEEDYTSLPSYHPTSFGDALAHALEQSRLDAAGRKSDGAGKKKKKKGKSTVLFTTSMAGPP